MSIRLDDVRNFLGSGKIVPEKSSDKSSVVAVKSIPIRYDKKLKIVIEGKSFRSTLCFLK